MKRTFAILILIVFQINLLSAQNEAFLRFEFLLGNWTGTGSGFGNEKSKVDSYFKYVLNKKYIEVKNESFFNPTDEKPGGEKHSDIGYISYDRNNKKFVFRQFNTEGFVNNYILNDSLSDDSLITFETIYIENFVERGKARWTIKKLTNGKIETSFDVSMPDKEYTCFSKNYLERKD